MGEFREIQLKHPSKLIENKVALDYQKFMKSLSEAKEKGKYNSLYLLHGPEAYYIDEAVKWMENNILNETEKSFGQVVMYGKDTKVSDLISQCKQFPFMSDKQLIILKEAQDLKGMAELEPYFEHPAATTILVLCIKYKNFDKRLKAYKILEKNAVIFESKEIKEEKLSEWIQDYVKEKGYRVAPKAAFLLSQYIGNNLEHLSNSIDLLTLAVKDGEAIDEKAVENTIGISKEYNTAELVKALSTRNLTKLSGIMRYMENQIKDNPIQMISVILNSLFGRAALAEGQPDKREAFKNMGVGWGVEDYLNVSQHYSGKLMKIQEIILEYDLKSKGVENTGTEDSKLLREMIYKIVYT